MTSAVARLASTFGPAHTPMTPVKSQTPVALTEATNGVSVAAGVGGGDSSAVRVMLIPG